MVSNQRLEELQKFVAKEAEDRNKSSMGRRATALVMSEATTKELRESKKLAEKMLGRRMMPSLATAKAARESAEIDNRIADKYEVEICKLDDIAAALRELLELRQREEWVKVSERLPELYTTVIVAHVAEFSFVKPSEWNGKTWKGLELTGGVTHWRLLPAPPKEGL